MKDKYYLKLKENIFLAKKLIVDSIYCGIKLEGSKLTFPETKTILDGVNVSNAALDDIQAILNMRDAWRYVLRTIEEPLTLEYICKVNEYVARNESLEWGVLRYGNVGISGTTYKPTIPIKEEAIKGIDNILNKDSSNTEKALTYFLWGARSQLFWDGNKRTSLIVANKILISHGNGILTIADKDIEEFNRLLTNFYETNNNTDIKKFLYEKTIRGIDFN